MRVEALQDRERERGRLSRARLSRSDDVAAFQGGWYGAELDGRRIAIAHGLNPAQKWLGQSKLGKFEGGNSVRMPVLSTDVSGGSPKRGIAFASGWARLLVRKDGSAGDGFAACSMFAAEFRRRTSLFLSSTNKRQTPGPWNHFRFAHTYYEPRQDY